MARLYDITPEVTPALAVWPGDTPPAREVLLDMQRGDNLTLSTLHSTVHLGAHADAPSHYVAEGASIESCPLETYLGRCQVIRVDPGRGERMVSMPCAVEAPRVLFATGTFPDPEKFNRDFAAFSTDLLDTLAAAGVVLVGIDTPSVDLFDSKELPAHQACARHGLALLEGLVLRDVPVGVYELIALPLRLTGFDASPVRAVLRDL